MIKEACSSHVRELVEVFRILYTDANLFFVGLPGGLLNLGEDLGSDSRPSYHGHKKIAGQLFQSMSMVLNWSTDASEIYE